MHELTNVVHRLHCSVMGKTTRFDAADYLDSEKRQVAYITAALETGDADFVRDALGIVARARGLSGIAKNAGLNRESLYKALGENGNPEFATIMRIVRALGLTLSARPAAARRTPKRKPRRKERKGLARAFEIIANLPDDFLADGRKDSPPQERKSQ
jgi:probable addiction module antidote protein